jgi:predicted lipoprotein DUF2380
MRGVVLAGVLVLCACATPPAKSRASRVFAEGAVGGGANPGFNPTTDAYNPNFDGPNSSHAPVFVIPWKQSTAATEQEKEAERQRYIAMYKTYWVRDPGRYEEHHLFPRAFRKQFQELGIDVDLFTVLVDPEKHKQAHSGQEMYGPGGLWNWEWEQWLKGNRETAQLPEVWARAFEMIEKYRLGPHGPLSPYRCGRDVVHDQFDVLVALKQPSAK